MEAPAPRAEPLFRNTRTSTFAAVSQTLVCSVTSVRLGELGAQFSRPVSPGGLLLHQQVSVSETSMITDLPYVQYDNLNNLPRVDLAATEMRFFFFPLSESESEYFCLVLSAEMCCRSRCSYQTPSPKQQRTDSWRPSHTWDKVHFLPLIKPPDGLETAFVSPILTVLATNPRVAGQCQSMGLLVLVHTITLLFCFLVFCYYLKLDNILC